MLCCKMIAAVGWWKTGLAALVVLAMGPAAQAQLIKKPSDLDPFNKNSGIRQGGRDVDRERIRQTESALGGRFEVTVRNPGKNSVYYKFNGEEQIALSGGMQRTHRGVGTPEIRFDRGLKDGSYFAYTLSSGKSYSFRWQDMNLPEVGRARVLNLHRD